jgi:gas vesicle protein GvpL/GvpF
VIELLAITDGTAAPKPPVRAIRSGDLSALFVPAGEREATPEALWRHEEVLEELMEERDLLPVRFGTVVRDEQAAAQAVAERHDELVAGLDRVRGAIEVAVRVRARDPEPEPVGEPAGGRDYLRAKQRRTAAARRLHEPLAELARDAVMQSGSELLRAAYLVNRADVERFVARVHALQEEHPELALICTGPWPPYSFAEPGSRP